VIARQGESEETLFLCPSVDPAPLQGARKKVDRIYNSNAMLRGIFAFLKAFSALSYSYVC